MRRSDSQHTVESTTRTTVSHRRTFLKGGAAGAAALLSGCIGWGDGGDGGGGGDGGDGGGTETGGTVTDGGDDDLAGTTINMLEYAAAQAEATQQVLPQFEEETGITVNLETAPYGDLISKQFTSLEGSSGSYDVIDVDVPYWPAFVSNDWIQPLNDRLTQSDLPRSDFLQRVWDDTVVWGTPDDYLNLDAGKIMGIPYQPNVLTLYYRKDLYDEAGLSPPQTLADYQRVARELTDPDQNLYGMAMMAKEHESLLVEWKSMLYARGGRFFEDETIEEAPFGISESWNPVFDNQTAVDTLKYYKELVDADYTPDGVTSWDWTDVTQNFIQGRLATGQAFSSTARIANDPEQSEVAGKVGYAPYPGSDVSGTMLRRPHYGTWSLAIPKNSQKKRAAWRFIEWLSSTDVQIERARYGAQPSRQSAYDHLTQSGNEVFQTSPAFFQALYEGLTEYGIGRPKIKGYFEWSSTMQKWLTRSITQGMEPQKALSNAADDTRQLLGEQGY
jgi:multiple sugar transport system substrate-binding protein